MIKVENIDVYGFEAAIRGMRNPMNSWDKSDSMFHIIDKDLYEIGENDLDLMQRLYKAGTEHRKYLRFVDVTMDICAPLYWWKEFDTYRFCEKNSCSTMHKIHSKEFTVDDFSHEHLLDEWGKEHEDELVCFDGEYTYSSKAILSDVVVPTLNHYRKLYLETKSKRYWWQMIQLLPSSYNQKRTVKFNYEVAVNIIRQRKGHKLDEWHVLVDELMKLPYLKEIAWMV